MNNYINYDNHTYRGYMYDIQIVMCSCMIRQIWIIIQICTNTTYINEEMASNELSQKRMTMKEVSFFWKITRKSAFPLKSGMPEPRSIRWGFFVEWWQKLDLQSKNPKKSIKKIHLQVSTKNQQQWTVSGQVIYI